MATIEENLQQLANDVSNIKTNLGLSSTASLNDVVNKSEKVIEPTGTIDITANGTVDVKNYESANVNVSGGGGGEEKVFTGHYDVEGLKAIGWSNEEIAYYQKNGVQWNEEDDNLYKLTEEELAGDESANTRFLPKNSTKTYLGSYRKLLAFPMINDLNLKTSYSSTFSSCYSLTTIPQIDTSLGTNFTSMFSACSSLTTIPEIDTSLGTNFSSMFATCYSLKTIPRLNTSKGTLFNGMFNNCTSLTTIPEIDTSLGTNFSSMFSYSYALKSIPQLNTGKGTNFSNMFSYCSSLKTIPELDASLATNVSNMFYECSSLTNFGGLKNLGMSFSTTASQNYNNYTINLSRNLVLTHDSLMNIINNLYDIKSKGCRTQSLSLGSINLAKLTAEEIEIATNKGWNVA